MTCLVCSALLPAYVIGSDPNAGVCKRCVVYARLMPYFINRLKREFDPTAVEKIAAEMFEGKVE